MANGAIRFRTRWGAGNPAYPEGAGVNNLDAPAALDPTTPPSIVSAPSLWGAYCLRNDHSAGMRSFVDFDITASPEGICIEHEFFLLLESLADGQLFNVLSTKNQSNVISRFQVDQVAGVHQLTMLMSYDGSSHILAGSPAVVFPSRHRTAMYWDITNQLWACYFDGVLIQSGVITGAALAWQLDNIQPGGVALDGNSATHFAGPLLGYSGPYVPGKYENTFTPNTLSGLGSPGPTLRRITRGR